MSSPSAEVDHLRRRSGLATRMALNRRDRFPRIARRIPVVRFVVQHEQDRRRRLGGLRMDPPNDRRADKVPAIARLTPLPPPRGAGLAGSSSRHAGGGTRTPKGFRPPAPKAGVSTNSTTPARRRPVLAERRGAENARRGPASGSQPLAGTRRARGDYDPPAARVPKLVKGAVSKAAARKSLWVRVPPRASVCPRPRGAGRFAPHASSRENGADGTRASCGAPP